MNINVNIPAGSFDRLMTVLERIAYAAEKIAGPDIRMEMPKPFAPELWGYSSNELSLQTELEEHRETQGYGQTYQAELEERARAAGAGTANITEREERSAPSPSKP